VVAITHFMDEITQAQRVLVLDAGHVALEGTPREVLAQADVLEALGLALPPAAVIARGLAVRGANMSVGVVTPEELVAAVVARARAA